MCPIDGLLPTKAFSGARAFALANRTRLMPALVCGFSLFPAIINLVCCLIRRRTDVTEYFYVLDPRTLWLDWKRHALDWVYSG